MKFSKEQRDELNKLIQPVIEFMQNETNPHAKLIVTALRADLTSGTCGFVQSKQSHSLPDVY